MVKGVRESSELVCVVPKGNPVRIMEKVRGPIYKAQYKNWNGYIISFNLENRLQRLNTGARKPSVVGSSSKKTYITLSRKTYITKKDGYKMVIAVPKSETLEVLDRVKKGKFLVRYKSHIGFTELGSFNVQNEVSQALLSTMRINKSSGSKSFIEQYPPIVHIDDIRLSRHVLNAGGSTRLAITLSNSGIGDANRVFVRLSSQNSAIKFPSMSSFPVIKADGGVATIHLDIEGESNLVNGISTLDIEVIEEEFKGPVLQRQVRLETEEIPRPILVIPQYALHEVSEGNANNSIELNEVVDLSFTIRNDGRARAERLKISVDTDQQGIILLGVVKENAVQRLNTQVKTISPGELYHFTYRYFVNSEFQGQDLKFKISGSDQYHGFDFSAELEFPLNQRLGRSHHYLDQVVQRDMHQRNELDHFDDELPIGC